jgi:predicted DNA-binding transcriptional regulator YafY
VRAVHDRHVVELVYDGDGTPRLVEPHVVYRSSTGKVMLDAFQLAGPTHSGAVPGWRQFELDRIARVTIVETPFMPAPDYQPDSDRYGYGVIAQV